MRLSTILKVLAVLVVAVIVGGIVLLMNIDFNQYKGLIAEKVKEATGRTLAIDGDIELELSLNPALSVSSVKFQNAAWGSRPQMVVVDKFSAQVALLPLLTKTIEVEHVLLKSADILVERNAEGRMNFEFAVPTKADKPKSKQIASEAAEEAEELPIPVARKVLIQDAKLTYIDAGTGGAGKLLKGLFGR